MGIMFAMQCDTCEEIQVKKAAHEISGRTYTENGVTKFACRICSERQRAVLALSKKGLEDPIAAAGRLLLEKDAEIRNLELVQAAKRGDLQGVAEELKRKREEPRIPVLGMDFESDYRRAKSLTDSRENQKALPAPKKKRKK